MEHFFPHRVAIQSVVYSTQLYRYHYTDVKQIKTTSSVGEMGETETECCLRVRVLRINYANSLPLERNRTQTDVSLKQIPC